MSAIYEIAIQKVKAGQDADYGHARAAFLEELKKQPGVEQDWTFRSFFTMPEPDDTQVIVGLTRWTSIDDFKRASDKLMPTDTAAALFSRVDMKAFVQATPVTANFKLEEQLSGSDAVLEVAVRRAKAGVSEESYQAARKGFFDLIAQQPGYLFDEELTDAEGARIVLIGWNSTDAFQTALGVLSSKPEMGAFMSLLDVQAYQASTLA